MAKSLLNPPPKIPPWSERNELNLLNAVLEIANEPTESYDPGVNLFDRINKNMEKSLTDREILGKIKELRNRFEKRFWKREFGNKAVKTTKAFAISEKIWGKGIDMKIERERRENNAKSLKVNPREASRPNPKQGHGPTKKRNSPEPKYKCQPDGKKQKFKGSCFVCGINGHIARDCSKQKVPTKQQESTNTSESSVLRFETENKHKKLSTGSGLARCDDSSKVNRSRPNHKREHELRKKRDGVESKCKWQPACKKQKKHKKKIARQPTKHQETEDISKSSVELQFEGQNKCEELSGESAVASSQPASLQLGSDQTWQGDEVPGCFLPVAQGPSWELRMKVYYSSQPDANQHASGQGMQAFSNFRPSPPPNFRPPPIPLQPPSWGPPPVSPQPPNCGPPLIPLQPSNWGPPNCGPPPQPPNCGPPPLPSQPPNWGSPNPITVPYSYPAPPIPFQYPPPSIIKQTGDARAPKGIS